MTIGLKFYTIVVPFEKVGGYGYLSNFISDRIGPGVWYDKDLLCMNGGMAGNDAEFAAIPLEEWGLLGLVERNGKQIWQDFCICTSGGGPWRGACDWLEYDEEKNAVAMPGTGGPTILPNLSLINDKPEPGARIRCKVFSNHGVEAGFVVIDDVDFGYNYERDGVLNLLIPSEVVQRLNAETDLHTLHIHNLVLGNVFSLEFRLVDGESIVLPDQALDGEGS